ncbi:polysaccharide deacetylase family protein [Phaeobacter sp. C3_T13_0]|uniref:polysaccharide deacetylase family protein n=1 Tax=Phaeobacter cretensis TaxID=3342641 RepID=UPI0039BC3696
MIWNPEPYPWPKPYRAAFCFSVDVDATAPYLWQHRNGVPKTLAAFEHRQYGMRRGLARITNMLDRIGVKGTFFVPGAVAEENPDLLPGLLERGQEIALHGYFHELVGDISDSQFTHALERSIDLFVAQTGKPPTGFRSPAWEMTPHMISELARLGLWDSSLMGEDVPYRIGGVTEIPVRWDNDDAIFFKFLGPGDKSPRPDCEVAEQWRQDAHTQIDDGGLYMLTVHDWISGRANRVAHLENLMAYVMQADDDIWITSCGGLAAHHKTVAGGLNVPMEQILPTVKGFDT